jgi:hypothetical protein
MKYVNLRINFQPYFSSCSHAHSPPACVQRGFAFSGTKRKTFRPMEPLERLALQDLCVTENKGFAFNRTESLFLLLNQEINHSGIL